MRAHKKKGRVYKGGIYLHQGGRKIALAAKEKGIHLEYEEI